MSYAGVRCDEWWHTLLDSLFSKAFVMLHLVLAKPKPNPAHFVTSSHLPSHWVKSVSLSGSWFRNLIKTVRHRPPQLWIRKCLGDRDFKCFLMVPHTLTLKQSLLFSLLLLSPAYLGGLSALDWSPQPPVPSTSKPHNKSRLTNCGPAVGYEFCHDHRLMCELMWAQAGGRTPHLHTQWTPRSP